MIFDEFVIVDLKNQILRKNLDILFLALVNPRHQHEGGGGGVWRDVTDIRSPLIKKQSLTHLLNQTKLSTCSVWRR